MSVSEGSSRVLQDMMEDGTFDDFRQKIVNHLKENESLRGFTAELVERSETLGQPGVASRPRKDLFETLRKEIEEPVMEMASSAAWDVLLSDQGVGKEIKEKVEAMLQRTLNEL
mmetsp:Transcript_29772/g.41110  ORF Transcript_29772/g.41110 Transcript_29772/m.41110 type:complete len:114 (-) Transcript_29772:169-510(-)|eukprot:CAMPEP_0196573314 /NCGR_PEP_ID=MMETSP1081-20130531/3237_1 /TAXON_ID=36882 /ORGANISM="Pyramimonas amylifera, Strain CCMP720" /LENGTH=113 /DNA_ID=CAMNT_0041890975 /DNA_START=105 /DNA_END=446 /DNA_ORIENTATION=+